MTISIRLASKSPRRSELLTQIGVNFSLLDVDVEEQALPGEEPSQYVERLSISKARAGSSTAEACVVLGADTIVVLQGQILEKPKDQADAIAMLMALSGNTHNVYTSVALSQKQADRGYKEISVLCRSDVTFRDITEIEAEQYWSTGEPKDKAGGYGIQGLGAVFVEHLQGSYSNVVGLPLMETQKLLSEFGIPVWTK